MSNSSAMNAFGKNVAALVRHQGITLQDLSERCNIRRSYLSRLVHGHHSPSLDVVESIAMALHVQPHELITPGFSQNLSNAS